MNYSISIVPRAEKTLSKINSPTYEKIKKEIGKLEKTPKPVGVKKLKGREGYRIRIGNYRIIYSIDDIKKMILILGVDHRKDIYR
ncbi:MAG: type II toxin-antitoxin system RelE/ParE family toxin [Leptospiraceae bacterium]|nr:type II toxin-antitoxin system RelE/ParE family toxin [Leptospiraceae bacterium]MCK6382269.1 type II toxin-antitoxin system RelE/ParE family toxin [Leptospiraceae bacterium]NUM41878.1 type II toxin-antitoxin system RelE/ParE family toxin [Leptospiraceae bacterium]